MNARSSIGRQYLFPLCQACAITTLTIVMLASPGSPAAASGSPHQEATGSETVATATEDESAPGGMQAIEQAEPEPAEAAAERPGAVHISGEKPIFRGLANDLFAWAWLPEVAGTVEDNTFIGGQRVAVHSDATIGGDLFIFAQSGTVAGQIAGDVYCFCQDLTITAEGSVGGRLESMSEMLSINGFVEGPIDFSGGILTIDGTLVRGGSVTSGSVEIGPNAQVGGLLEYESSREAIVDPEAVVSGELRRITPAIVETEQGDDAKAGWLSLSTVLWKLWHFGSSFLVGALLLAVGGAVARAPAASLTLRPAHSLGFGFVISIVMPVGAIIAMAVVLGIPLGVLTLLLFLVVLYLARLVTAQALGAMILRRVGASAEPSAYAALAVGLVLYFVLVAIPYLGFLLWLGAIYAGLGGIFMAMRPQTSVEVAPAA